MVCVIIDTNLAFRIFTSVPEDDFRPVFDWLHAPDKKWLCRLWRQAVQRAME
jgi:hypothetical protein